MIYLCCVIDMKFQSLYLTFESVRFTIDASGSRRLTQNHDSPPCTIREMIDEPRALLIDASCYVYSHVVGLVLHLHLHLHLHLQRFTFTSKVP
jgi:hypothetical protein